MFQRRNNLPKKLSFVVLVSVVRPSVNFFLLVKCGSLEKNSDGDE